MREALRPSEQNELDHFLRPDDARGAKKEQKTNKRPLKILLCLPTAGKRMIILKDLFIFEVDNAKNVRSHSCGCLFGREEKP